MCTVTYDNPVLQIAKKDILVYKQVFIIYKPKTWVDKILFRKKKVDHYKSSVEGFEYLPNKVYKTKLDPFKEEEDNLYYSGRGFYSYASRSRLYVNNNVKCIIPKGSKYYIALDGLDYIYHSDQIKIIGEC